MDEHTKEIITNVTATLVENGIKSGWNKIIQFFDDLTVKDDIHYGIAYEDYLANTQRKYSKIKTIIYRRAPQDLYTFYECIGVSYNGNTISTQSILNLVDISNKIIITGTGGVGKSIMFKHLFLNTINVTDFIPVLIELRSFNIIDNKDINLYEAIYKTLCDNGFTLSKEHFEYSMLKGGYIIILDGYDEINNDKETKVTSEIKAVSDKYKDNKYIVSSRPSEEFIGWNDFAEMTTEKLTKPQALSLIQKIDFDPAVKEIFYKQLNDSLYDKYESFASNPLLLNIMLLTFNKHAAIPAKLNDFYEEAFLTLFNMHDATKDSYVRDIRTDLGSEDFKLIFAYICFKSYFNGDLAFTETKLRNYIQMAKDKFDHLSFTVEDFQDDLTFSVCMLVKEGLNYRFSHRSFQEYFAAWYTCKLVDDVQVRLLSGWLKESPSVMKDSYFSMLFDLQSEKVNRIILYPALKDFYKLYEMHGMSLSFLKEIFKGIVIKKIKTKDGNYLYTTSLRIENKLLCYSVVLCLKLNKYKYPSINDSSKIEKLSNQLNDIFGEGLTEDREMFYSFDQVSQVGSEEDILDLLKWFEYQISFVKSILDKYDDNHISKKRKVSSIIDSL